MIRRFNLRIKPMILGISTFDKIVALSGIVDKLSKLTTNVYAVAGVRSVMVICKLVSLTGEFPLSGV